MGNGLSRAAWPSPSASPPPTQRLTRLALSLSYATGIASYLSQLTGLRICELRDVDEGLGKGIEGPERAACACVLRMLCALPGLRALAGDREPLRQLFAELCPDLAGRGEELLAADEPRQACSELGGSEEGWW